MSKLICRHLQISYTFYNSFTQRFNFTNQRVLNAVDSNLLNCKLGQASGQGITGL